MSATAGPDRGQWALTASASASRRSPWVMATVVGLLAAVLTAGLAMTAHAGQPGPKERCPVCGMFVAPYTTWMASVVLDDGRRVYFDGPKDMFRFLLDRGRFGSDTGEGTVVEIWVKDYYTTLAIDARTAHFVVGSDVMGPMGHELVPTASADAAQTLLSDHHGTRVLRFDQVTAGEIP